MDFTIGLGLGGWIVLAVGAVVIGAGAQLFGDVDTSWQWLFVGIAAFAGGFVASEWITALRGFEPVWDGLALVPALTGGLLVGVVVDAIVRFSTGGAYERRTGAIPT